MERKEFIYKKGDSLNQIDPYVKYDLIDLSDYKNTSTFQLSFAKAKKLILPEITFFKNETLIDCECDEIVFPKTLKSILANSIKNKNIKELNFTDTRLERIAGHAAKNNTYIEKVVIPICVTFAMHAFENCTSLKEINLENASYLHKNCFAGCTSLEQVSLDGFLTGRDVFRGCENLKSVMFLENFNANFIDDVMTSFKDCPKLQNIYIDKNMEKNLQTDLKSLFRDLNITDNKLDFLIDQNKSFKEINKVFNKGIDYDAI